MQPTSPLRVTQDGEPNVEVLRSKGWSISLHRGTYCVAWRGRDEVVLEWRGGCWEQVGGRGSVEGL